MSFTGCKDKLSYCADYAHFCSFVQSFKKDCPKTCNTCKYLTRAPKEVRVPGRASGLRGSAPGLRRINFSGLKSCKTFVLAVQAKTSELWGSEDSLLWDHIITICFGKPLFYFRSTDKENVSSVFTRRHGGKKTRETKKRQPCWCTRLILRKLNSIFM